MPKRILMALALCALGLAACNSGYNPVNSTTPTPTPTASYSPNPSITTVTVTVTVTSSPLPGAVVNEYLEGSDGRPSGSALASATTNASGQVTFSGLTPSQSYCWNTTYSNPPAGFNSQVCTLFWQHGISLGD